MKLIVYAALTPAQKKQVKAAFVHWHYDTTVSTFEEWAYQHAFSITNKGRLAHRPAYCEPASMAQGEDA